MPQFIRNLIETVLSATWRTITVSRQAINTILRKRRRNGSPYKKNKKEWKFFRAEHPNDLWQIDIKGPFLMEGKRVNALLILDDYSRFLLSVQFFQTVTTEVVTKELNNCVTKYRKPGKILTDNGPQFRNQFTEWCMESARRVEVIHAPPFYPQCKGKIERCIRNFNEEFLPLDKVFEDPTSLIEEYRDWYNNERYNLGIQACPAQLYIT